jgi:hypothetical protein
MAEATDTEALQKVSPIVLNADLGKGFGTYTIDGDEQVMPLITSANIACGFRAGDPRTLDTAVSAARAHGVRVGAHPGFPIESGADAARCGCAQRRSPPTSCIKLVRSKRSAAGTRCGCNT